LAAFGEQLARRGPELAAFVEVAFVDRAGLEAAEDRGLHRLGGAQLDRQLDRRDRGEGSRGGEDRRPPEIGERDEADGVVKLGFAVIAQAEPAAGERFGGAGEGRRAEAGS